MTTKVSTDLRLKWRTDSIKLVCDLNAKSKTKESWNNA